MTISCTRRPRSSAARALRRSRTRLPERPSASQPRLPLACEQHWVAGLVPPAPTLGRRLRLLRQQAMAVDDGGCEVDELAVVDARVLAQHLERARLVDGV